MKMSLVDLINTRVQQKVDNLVEFSNLNNSIQQGIGFSIYSLERIFSNFNNTEIENGIVDSSFRQEMNDYGIDAIYITANKECIESVEQLEDYNDQSKFGIHILQFKKGTGIDNATLLKLQDGIKKSFILDDIDESSNEYMYEHLVNLKKIRQHIFENFPIKNITVKVHLVFSGSTFVTNEDAYVQGKIKDIKNDLFSSGYTNVEFEIYGAQELLDLENGNADISDILEYKQSFKYVTAGANEKKLNGHIAIVKGEEIAKLVEKYQNSLFELNIRDFYTNNPNNGRIIETAASEEESKFFWSFNNGLTVTCKEVEDLPENKLKVSGMQIVNGCQTSNSIYKAYSNKKRYDELVKKDELSKKEQDEIDKIKDYCLDSNTSVLIKIIETQDEDLVYRITESTNSQTAITSFSIKANEDIHKNIETFMKDYNVYYERRVNFYRNQKDISTKDIIDIKKMAQVFMSMIKICPSQAMSSPKAMFTNNYKSIFPDPSTNHNIDYKLYLIPALVQQHVEQKIKTIQRKKEEKKLFNKKILSYGKFHLGCFILSSILERDYNERGISRRFDDIKNNLEDASLFDGHFKKALERLREGLVDLGCDNEDAVSQYLRSKEIDNKIASMVRGTTNVKTTKVKVKTK
jgi:AIPR protein